MTRHLARVCLLRRLRCLSVRLSAVQRTNGIDVRAWTSCVREARRCIAPDLDTSCSWPFACMGFVQSGPSVDAS
jgi:hypothetical protein